MPQEESKSGPWNHGLYTDQALVLPVNAPPPPQTPTFPSLEHLPFLHWRCGQGGSFKGNEPIMPHVRALPSTITSPHLPSFGPGLERRLGNPGRL